MSSRGRVRFGRPRVVSTPGEYTIISGTKAPVGSAGMTAITIPIIGNTDNGYTSTTLANTFNFYGTGYTTVVT